MFGLAVLFSSASVAAMSRESAGCACQSSATTPTTCGPAIEVPLHDGPEYCESLPFSEELTLTPGAEMSGLIRFEPSTVTGPRLLKPASATGFPVYVVAPVEYDASEIAGGSLTVLHPGPPLPADTSTKMPAARVFSTIVWRLSGAQSSLVGQPQL